MELKYYYQTEGEEQKQIVELLNRHFSNEDFSYNDQGWEHLADCEFMKALGFSHNGEILSWASAMITTPQGVQDFTQQKIPEEQLPPYDPRSGQPTADLFWLSLVFEDKKHAPYLIRRLFKDLEATCRKWKINLKNVYAIAYTQLSRRLMLRYQFNEVGLYEGKYSIMHATVNDNPYLKAIIPYINENTNKPW